MLQKSRCSVQYYQILPQNCKLQKQKGLPVLRWKASFYTGKNHSDIRLFAISRAFTPWEGWVAAFMSDWESKKVKASLRGWIERPFSMEEIKEAIVFKKLLFLHK